MQPEQAGSEWVHGGVLSLWSLESKFPCLPCTSLIPQFQDRSFKVFMWQVQPCSQISWVHPPPGAWYLAQRQKAYIYFTDDGEASLCKLIPNTSRNVGPQGSNSSFQLRFSTSMLFKTIRRDVMA